MYGRLVYGRVGLVLSCESWSICRNDKGVEGGVFVA